MSYFKNNKKMKKINTILASLALPLILGLGSCTDRFDLINTDSNKPVSVTSDLLMNPLLRSIVQDQFNYNGGSALAHHLSRTNYNEVEQYAFGTNEGEWNACYLRLNNIREMIGVSQRDNRPSCEAIGYILQAFVASQLTDLWGDVPYFDAAMGASEIKPVYNSQKEIYTAEGGVIDLLGKAADMLASNNDPLPSDIVYGGDRLKWLKLANSLKLRYLMRISGKAAEVTSLDVSGEIRQIMGAPLMEDNKDNMSLKYLASVPNKCPIFEMRSGEFEYVRMSDEIAARLNLTSDPREGIWFSPTANSSLDGTALYKGIPSGCSSTTLTNIGYSQSDVSLLGSRYRISPDACSAVLMNCSEVKFLQAEAVARGYADGNAEQLYCAGIKASLDFYGVKELDAQTFLENPAVKYDEGKGLEMIMGQKWLSLFMVGYEAWFDFLRTGLPVQKLPMDNRNPTAAGEVPSRFYYPESEQANNKVNYEKAVKSQGSADDINTKLWWEK